MATQSIIQQMLMQKSMEDSREAAEERRAEAFNDKDGALIQKQIKVLERNLELLNERIQNPPAMPEFASRKEAVEKMDLDTAMYNNVDSSGFLHIRGGRVVEEPSKEEKSAALQKRFADTDMDAIRKAALELINNKELLAAEARYEAAQKTEKEFEKQLEDKYKDAPKIDFSKAPYQYGDEFKPGGLTQEEKDDIATRHVVGARVIRITPEEAKKEEEVSKEYRDAADNFFGTLSDPKGALDKAIEQAYPQATYHEKILLGNFFHRSADFLPEGQEKAKEVEKETAQKGEDIGKGLAGFQPKDMNPLIKEIEGKNFKGEIGINKHGMPHMQMRVYLNEENQRKATSAIDLNNPEDVRKAVEQARPVDEAAKDVKAPDDAKAPTTPVDPAVKAAQEALKQ